MTSDKELRLGVIGAGGRGTLAGHAHKPDEGVRLVAAADLNEKVLFQFKEKYGPDVFLTQDYKALVSRPDIDAVFITSPDYCHKDHAVAALKAGKDVYLEKPMAITIESCDRIMETAYKTNMARKQMAAPQRDCCMPTGTVTFPMAVSPPAAPLADAARLIAKANNSAV